PPTRSTAKPARRNGSGWRDPGGASRDPSRSRYQVIVSSIASSCGDGFQPSARLALVLRNVHHIELPSTSVALTGGRPGIRSTARAKASAAGAGTLTAGGSTP